MIRPSGGSSLRHRIKAPYLGFEFLSGLHGSIIMPKRPEPPKRTSWNVYKIAKKADGSLLASTLPSHMELGAFNRLTEFAPAPAQACQPMASHTTTPHAVSQVL
jgi:hypothetical protein